MLCVVKPRDPLEESPMFLVLPLQESRAQTQVGQWVHKRPWSLADSEIGGVFL